MLYDIYYIVFIISTVIFAAIRHNSFLNKIFNTSKNKNFFSLINTSNSIRIEMEFSIEEIIRES